MALLLLREMIDDIMAATDLLDVKRGSEAEAGLPATGVHPRHQQNALDMTMITKAIDCKRLRT